MKKILALILALAMVLSMAACGGGSSDPGSSTENPGSNEAPEASGGNTGSEGSDGSKILDNGRYEKLVVAIAEDPQDLEGDDVNVGSRYYWIYGVYESLFDFADDGSGELVPCLAKSYEETDDGMSWTITLNDDITDWDGNNITSSDVKFCFDWIVDHGQAIRFDFFDSIEVIDDYTFKMNFTAVPPAVHEIEFPLVRTLIYSEKAYNDHGGMTTDPCGTGCYKVTEFVPGSKVVMEANDDYWGLGHSELTGRHKATVQTLELDVVTEASTAVVGLESGTLDVCGYVTLADVDKFTSRDDFSVVEVTQGDYWYLAPNAESVDENLRKAIFYALDSAAICTAMGGQYVPANSIGNEAYSDWDDSLAMTGSYLDTYDMDKAKEYLEQSDYNGETLTLICVSNETAKNACTMVQVLLSQVGINVEINAVTNDIYNTITSPAHSSEWDMMLNTLGGPSMVGSWHLIMDNEVNNGVTFSLIDDPKLQELYEAANADATHDAAHMKECLDYVIDNAYIYVLANMSTALVYTSDLQEMYYREGYYTPGASTFVGQ